MKRPVLMMVAVLLAALIGRHGMAETTKADGTTKKRSKTMSSAGTSRSADVVREFFGAFGKGDVDGVINTFHTDASITAVRKGERKGNHYGSYAGKEGAKAFVAALGTEFDTQAFAVNHVIGEGNVAFADGTFTHKVKATGKLFSSDWALMCVIQDGKIREYHFFEDSAAYAAAAH